MSYNTGNDDTTSSTTAGMFSYPSSPLFEQPFVNQDFYAEQTPLRSRASGNHADTPFVSTNPYFSSPSSRRKRSFHHYYNSNQHQYTQFSPDRWVKQVMRLVLLSPLIVLVLWSVGAVLFTSRKSAGQPKSQAVLLQQQASRARGSPGRDPREMLKEGFLEVVEVSGDLFGQAESPMAIAAQQQQGPEYAQPLLTVSQQQQHFHALQPQTLQALQPQTLQAVQDQQQPFPVYAPLPEIPQPFGSVQQPQPLGQAMQQPFGSVQQVGPLGSASHEHHNVIPVFNPLGGSSKQPNTNKQPSSNKQPTPNKQPSTREKAQGWMQNLLHQRNAPHNRLSNHNNVVVQPQHLRGSSNMVFYYYDPRSIIQGPGGQVYLPKVVYDPMGNPLETSQILNDQQASQVLIQPPQPYGMTTDNDTKLPILDEADGQLTQPNLPIQDPVRGISMPDLKTAVHNAEVKYTENGSSVIVATVAVMALLVGALSARRLRGQASVLSACIENERLDHAVDDAATDTNTAYSTFHWKGDLEKFDV